MQIYFTEALIIWIYVTAFFVVAAITKRNDLADVAWGLGFTVLAWTTVMISHNVHPRQILLGLMISIWSARLSGFILRRFLSRGEDQRYAEMRKNWKTHILVKSYLRVFVMQGCILFVLAFSMMMTMKSEKNDIGLLEAIGFSVWLAGFVFEAIADQQKHHFKEKPENRGRLIMSGLWSVSRHPNYFGESVAWWGVWIYACGDTSAIYSVFSPALLTFFLLKVSGVPLLEKVDRKRPEFEAYRKKTPEFIPWVGWK